jgi:hypothetical protein
LKRNFKYPNSVRFYTREAYGDGWSDLILTELKEGRAVAYSGHDPKKGYGHCFNLDGYDGSYYHVNWGWGSPNTYNGYFPLDGLKDLKMDMNYTSGQGAVVGIRPPSELPSDIYLSNRSVQAMKPAGTVVGTVTVESEAENPEYKFELKGKYSARQHKYLEAPFKIADGQLLTTKELSEGTEQLTITATNIKNNGSVERTFTINVTSTNGINLVETAPSVVSEEHYNLKGMRISNANARGLSIIRQRMSDGSSKAIKRIVN